MRNGVGSIGVPEVHSTNHARLQVYGSLAAFCGSLLIGLAIDHLGLKTGFGIVVAGAVFIIVTALILGVHLRPAVHIDRQSKPDRAMDLLAHHGLRGTLFTSAVGMCGLELFIDRFRAARAAPWTSG